jgi:predicted ATP-grasp superfamily ATP-dependent carboligase
VLGRFSGRKLRQTRESMGSARVGEAVWDEEVVESGTAMLRELDFHGVSQVEFKRDPRTGVLKLIEVNPRLWQWHGLSAECGVDLTRIAYWDLLGERREPLGSNRCGKRWSITLMAPDTAFQRPPYVDAVFARDDPKPGLVHGARFALELLHLR